MSSSTPVPTSVPTNVPTAKVVSPIPTVKISVTPSLPPIQVLGEEFVGTDSSKQPEQETNIGLVSVDVPSIAPKGNQKSRFLPFVFIAPGVVMIGAAVFVFLQKKNKTKSPDL